MGNFIKNLGEQVGSAGASGALGMGLSMLDEAIFGNRRRKKQIEQQQKLTDIQMGANLEMMDAQKKQQLEMWEATNYKAQIEQMKKAGLNPALIYGEGGGGLTSLGSGAVGSASGGTASNEAQSKIADIQMQGMGLQMQKTQAEIAKIKADTRATEEETKGADLKRDLTKMSIKQIAESIKNEATRINIEEAKSTLDKMRFGLEQTKTKQDIKISNWQIEKLREEVETIRLDNEITQEQRNVIMQKLQGEVIHMAIDGALKQSQIKLNSQQESKIMTEVQKMFTDAMRDDKKLKLDEAEHKLKEKMWNEGQPKNMNEMGAHLLKTSGYIINDLLGGIFTIHK